MADAINKGQAAGLNGGEEQPLRLMAINPSGPSSYHVAIADLRFLQSPVHSTLRPPSDGTSCVPKERRVSAEHIPTALTCALLFLRRD